MGQHPIPGRRLKFSKSWWNLGMHSVELRFCLNTVRRRARIRSVDSSARVNSVYSGPLGAFLFVMPDLCVHDWVTSKHFTISHYQGAGLMTSALPHMMRAAVLVCKYCFFSWSTYWRYFMTLGKDGMAWIPTFKKGGWRDFLLLPFGGGNIHVHGRNAFGHDLYICSFVSGPNRVRLTKTGAKTWGVRG